MSRLRYNEFVDGGDLQRDRVDGGVTDDLNLVIGEIQGVDEEPQGVAVARIDRGVVPQGGEGVGGIPAASLELVDELDAGQLTSERRGSRGCHRTVRIQ